MTTLQVTKGEVIFYSYGTHITAINVNNVTKQTMLPPTSAGGS